VFWQRHWRPSEHKHRARTGPRARCGTLETQASRPHRPNSDTGDPRNPATSSARDYVRGALFAQTQ
jgi:hypothetical protein